MKKISLSLFIIAALSAHASNAIIYQITRWWHPRLQQEVNILKDVHLDTQDFRITSEQRIDIVERESIAFRIVEDRTDYASQDAELKRELKNRFTKIHPNPSVFINNIPLANYKSHVRYFLSRYSNNYQQTVKASPMAGLHLLNNTFNAEFRYVSLFDTQGHIRLSLSHNERSILKRQIHSIIEEIASYTDHSALNAYYEAITKNGRLIAEKIDPSTELSRKDKVIIFSLEAKLLDARALHALYNNPDKKVVDIILGGAHGDSIEPIIEQLGYKRVVEVGVDTKQTNHTKIIMPILDIKRALSKPLSKKYAKPIQAKL